MTHTHLHNEIEVGHETPQDFLFAGITILVMAVMVTLILWNPDVEAIGTCIANAI